MVDLFILKCSNYGLFCFLGIDWLSSNPYLWLYAFCSPKSNHTVAKTFVK